MAERDYCPEGCDSTRYRGSQANGRYATAVGAGLASGDITIGISPSSGNSIPGISRGKGNIAKKPKVDYNPKP
jgi:hypothetical protein